MLLLVDAIQTLRSSSDSRLEQKDLDGSLVLSIGGGHYMETSCYPFVSPVCAVNRHNPTPSSGVCKTVVPRNCWNRLSDNSRWTSNWRTCLCVLVAH